MMPLVGRRVHLREIIKSDLIILHKWRNTESFMSFCSTRRNKVSLDEFDEELSADFSQDRHKQYLIFNQDVPVGTIYSYGLNHTDGHVYISIYIVPECERSGYGAEAFALFLWYLFESLSLYKVYTDAYSYNEHSISCLRHAGFVEEGRFKGHRIYCGERYDLIRLAFSQDEIPRLEKYVTRFFEARDDSLPLIKCEV